MMLNLTPHSITILDQPTGKTLTIPPSGTVARVTQDYAPAGKVVVEGLPVNVVRTEFGEVTGLPEDPTTPILVSSVVLAALKRRGRANVYAPDTNVGAVRDDKGFIQAVTCLITI